MCERPTTPSPENAALPTVDCPVCAKRAIQTITCPRCASELSILRTIDHDATAFALLAEQALASGTPARAATFAFRSLGLRKNVRAARAAFFAAIAAGGKPVEAMRLYHAAAGLHNDR